MKKNLALLLALVMTLSLAVLAGCGSKGETEGTTGTDETTAAPVGAIELSSFTATAGDYALTFEPIDLGTLEGSKSAYEFSGDYFNGKYYISDKDAKALYVYAIDGTTATLEKKYEFDDSYEKVSVNYEGKVILSQGIFEAAELNDDGSVTELQYKHDLECSKDKDFIVSTWVNADPKIIADGKESDWVFKNLNDPETREGSLSMVFDCAVSGDHIIIGGTYADGDEDDYRIGVFDFDGNELAMTAADDSVGYPALNETKNGIISANVGKIYLHDSECNPIGEINDLKSLAKMDNDVVSTFWVQDFSIGENGDVYMLVYASKQDDTCEALLYKVTGF